MPRRWPCAIDMHAHLMIPQMYRITGPHSMFVKSNTDPNMSEAAKQVVRDRDAFIESRMSDTTERLALHGRHGRRHPGAVLEPRAAMHLLGASRRRACGWSACSTSAWRRWSPPIRSATSGSAACRCMRPTLAAAELARCMTELKLAGVGISTTARDIELGDRRLRPFWEAAEAHGAVVYIHPAGNPDRRFEKWYLWNSIGQAFEEAMAIASLFYEGILDAYPKLKICVSHGGGYMPYYMGRIARNYLDKPATRVNMSKSPAEYLRMLYFDSCVYETEVLEALVKRVGADRVLLGSDYPVGEPKPIEFIEFLRALRAAEGGRSSAAMPRACSASRSRREALA